MDHGETVRVEDDTFIRRDGSPLPVAYSCSPLIAGSLHGVVVVFSDISERVAERRRRQGEIDALVWVGRIRDALDEDQFVLYAQPIIDLRSGAVVQHELLIRMLDRHDSGRIIPPSRFLPVAEKYGLIGEIDRWVIGQAAQLAASGRNVEFNLSAASVTDPDMASTIESAFKEANASPQKAVCEITETALLADDVAAEACVRQLAASGFGVALDDFGTGYGGFSYLSRLPVSIVKIDVEFVRDLLENEQSQHVVRAIVDLAKAFEKQTVAEGVEDLAALQLLKTMGVDFAQGYAIGRPAPLEDMFPAPAPP
jgi:EAL domain-containing protein (putative c-di-GMP-specific phosphodiesterase class I)